MILDYEITDARWPSFIGLDTRAAWASAPVSAYFNNATYYSTIESWDTSVTPEERKGRYIRDYEDGCPGSGRVTGDGEWYAGGVVRYSGAIDPASLRRAKADSCLPDQTSATWGQATGSGLVSGPSMNGYYGADSVDIAMLSEEALPGSEAFNSCFVGVGLADWRIRHSPTISGYLKVWFRKMRKDFFGATLTSEMLDTTYTWELSGSIELADGTGAENDANIVTSAVLGTGEVPAEYGLTVISIEKWSCLHRYTPIKDDYGNYINGFPPWGSSSGYLSKSEVPLVYNDWSNP